MKLKIFILSLLISNIVLSQEQPEIIVLEKFTTKQVGQMAIFPGCEKINPNDKPGLVKCMSTELNKLLGKGLEKFTKEFSKDGYSTAHAKVRFVIDKNGKIIQVQPLSDSIFIEANHKLRVASEKVIKDFASKLKPIKPALLEGENTPVNLQFDLPINYRSSISENANKKWREFVIYTMYDNEKKYEVRNLHDNDIINVYLLDGLNEKLVKTFESYSDLEMSAEYGQIFKNNKQLGLMADRKLDNKQHIRVYYSKENPKKFDVYSVNQDKEILREKITIDDIFCSDLYMKTILR